MKKKNSQKVAFMLGLVGLVALLSVIFGSYILNTNVDNRASAATVRKTTSTKSTSSTTTTSDFSQPIAASITAYEGGKALGLTDNIVAGKTYKISLTMPPVGDYEFNSVITGVFQTFATADELRLGDTVPGSLVMHYVGQDKFEGTFKASSLAVGRYILVKPVALRFTNGELGLRLTQRTGSYLEGGRVVAK